MRKTFRVTYDPDYYRGLGLLLVSCLPLVWALWRDAFTPQVFLAGLLCFSWGYAFLWRHDLNRALADLRAEVEELKRHLAAVETGKETETGETEEPTPPVAPDLLAETMPVAEDGNGEEGI